MDNKNKQVVAAIVGVLLLVIAVVGVTFAMYSFTGTGTKENYITTGSINMDIENRSSSDSAGTNSKVINLTNQYPISDAKGMTISDQNAEAAITVSASLSGTASINYRLVFDDVTPGTTLTAQYIRIMLTDEAGNPATGFGTAGSPAPKNFSDITDAAPLASGTFSATGSVSYKLRAWVSSDYDLPNQTVTDSNSNRTHSNQTTSETFSFKVKLVAEAA